MPWYSEAELRPLVMRLSVGELKALFKDVKTVGLVGSTGYIERMFYKFGYWFTIKWDSGSTSWFNIEEDFYRDRPNSVLFLIPEDRINMVKNGYDCGNI